VLVDHRFLAPVDTISGGALFLRAGDTVQIETRWEVPDSSGAPDTLLADSLEVSGDFSALGGGSTLPTVRHPGGVYVVTHLLPVPMTIADARDLAIPVSAAIDSFVTTDRRIRACVSNRPPRHVFSRIDSLKTAPYRTGDRVLIETIWESDLPGALRIVADFSHIVQDTSKARPELTSQIGNVYRFRWRVPLDVQNILADGPGKHIPIIAYDAGCGRTVSDTLRIDLDTQAPPTDGMALDPLPSVTTEDSVHVSGLAPGSSVVVVYRNRSELLPAAPVDSLTGAFERTIPLGMGENRIQVKGEDQARNSTQLFPISPVVVTRVDGAVLTVGSRYSRRDETDIGTDDIVLRDPTGLRGARLQIFNLEGDCIREAEAGSGTRLEFGFHWDGLGRDGDRAPQGYYLVRAEWVNGAGKSRALTQGLYLRD